MKTQGRQIAVVVSNSSSLPKHPTATMPSTVIPSTKQAEMLEVLSPVDTDTAILTAELSKRPGKRSRGCKVSFSNPVTSTSVMMDMPPVKLRAFAHKVVTPAELAALQMVQVMKVLTESGVDHKGRDSWTVQESRAQSAQMQSSSWAEAKDAQVGPVQSQLGLSCPGWGWPWVQVNPAGFWVKSETRIKEVFGQKKMYGIQNTPGTWELWLWCN
ncbi:hypothetical protein DFH08DRAFT_798721 [Mycena albidolilacea]|uniref:Uncharacterized protein n=1 Tax=Mycena albidolilacea TaxID=1033008 RepID=A0AAD7F265_9AGAR|nr:hypothetical protein DFH08DRAFT_798721 [Mycena albidolilacea]